MLLTSGYLPGMSFDLRLRSRRSQRSRGALALMCPRCAHAGKANDREHPPSIRHLCQAAGRGPLRTRRSSAALLGGPADRCSWRTRTGRPWVTAGRGRPRRSQSFPAPPRCRRVAADPLHEAGGDMFHTADSALERRQRYASRTTPVSAIPNEQPCAKPQSPDWPSDQQSAGRRLFSATRRPANPR
jgi:hypothetical protein